MRERKRGFRQGDIAGIGSLEARVLRALWQEDGWVSTASVHERIRAQGEISYNSVHTCLQRMAKKGYLRQQRGERGVWLFCPAMSQQEMVVSLVGDVWEFLVGRPPAAVCRFLTDALLGTLAEGQARDLREIVQQRYPDGSEPRKDESVTVGHREPARRPPYG